MLDFLNRQGQGREIPPDADPRLFSPLRQRYPQLSDDEFLKNYARLTITKKRTSKQSPANALTDAILKYINSHPCCKVYRINSMGVYDPRINERTGRPIGMRPSGQKEGLPDVIGSVYGLFCSIEVKIGADRQSDKQRLRKQEIEDAKGWYCIAKDFDTFKAAFDSRYQNVINR